MNHFVKGAFIFRKPNDSAVYVGLNTFQYEEDASSEAMRIIENSWDLVMMPNLEHEYLTQTLPPRALKAVKGKPPPLNPFPNQLSFVDIELSQFGKVLGLKYLE